MRVISQDGMFDFPYEHIAVYRCETRILCHWYAEQRSANTLAEYETEEKAVKAMDMLRNAYTGCLWTESHYDMAAQANVSDIVANNVVFQFPLNSEVGA